MNRLTGLNYLLDAIDIWNVILFIFIAHFIYYALAMVEDAIERSRDETSFTPLVKALQNKKRIDD